MRALTIDHHTETEVGTSSDDLPAIATQPRVLSVRTTFLLAAAAAALLVVVCIFHVGTSPVSSSARTTAEVLLTDETNCSTPDSEDKDWDKLTKDETEGAEVLGWTKESWECEGEAVPTVPPLPTLPNLPTLPTLPPLPAGPPCTDPKSEDKAWEDLSKNEQIGARHLGWDQGSWDCELAERTTGD